MDTAPAPIPIVARGLMTDAVPATVRAPAADRRSRPARTSTDARGLMTDAGPVTVRVPTAGRPAVPNPATVAAPAPSRAFHL